MCARVYVRTPCCTSTGLMNGTMLPSWSPVELVFPYAVVKMNCVFKSFWSQKFWLSNNKSNSATIIACLV